MKPNTVMMGFYDNTIPEDLLKTRSFPKKKRLLNYGLTNHSNGNIPQANSLNIGLDFEGKSDFKYEIKIAFFFNFYKF